VLACLELLLGALPLLDQAIDLAVEVLVVFGVPFASL